MAVTTSLTTSFTCASDDEADFLRQAVRRHGRFLAGEGVDLRNYCMEGATFGWSAVSRAVSDMHADSVTFLSRRMLRAIGDAVRPALSGPGREIAAGILDRIDPLTA